MRTTSAKRSQYSVSTGLPIRRMFSPNMKSVLSDPLLKIRFPLLISLFWACCVVRFNSAYPAKCEMPVTRNLILGVEPIKPTGFTWVRNLQQFHAFLALRNRLLGSLAADGNIFIWPAERAQNDFRRAASFSVLGLGAGGFNPGLPGLAAL